MFFWDSKEIPGGTPKKFGWHKLAVGVKSGEAAVYWNEKELKGAFYR